MRSSIRYSSINIKEKTVIVLLALPVVFISVLVLRKTLILYLQKNLNPSLDMLICPIFRDGDQP